MTLFKHLSRILLSLSLAIFTVTLMVPSDARAGLIVTQSETAFNLANVGSNFTLETFNSVMPGRNLGRIEEFGDLIVTNSGGIFGAFSSSACIDSNCLSIGQRVTLTFANPVAAVGLFIGAGQGATTDIFVDGIDIGEEATFSGDLFDPFIFLGIFDDMGGTFTSIQLPGPLSIFLLDNLSFTMDSPSREIPEPGMLALFGLGILGLGIARRRRHG